MNDKIGKSWETICRLTPMVKWKCQMVTRISVTGIISTNVTIPEYSMESQKPLRLPRPKCMVCGFWPTQIKTLKWHILLSKLNNRIYRNFSPNIATKQNLDYYEHWVTIRKSHISIRLGWNWNLVTLSSYYVPICSKCYLTCLWRCATWMSKPQCT